jgi:hypothetical protein
MGYYEEKKKYEEMQGIKPPEVNKCQKCKKGILVVTISNAGFGGRKTVFKSFCPACGNTIKKIV